MLRLVSITHPALGGAAGTKRLNLLSGAEVTILTPYETVLKPGDGLVRRISVPKRGLGRFTRLPSLKAALDVLAPDVVHLHADPDTSLAHQVASLCGDAWGRGLVLEAEMDPGCSPGVIRSLRARRVVSRIDAALAHTAGALSALRRLGFDGPGLITGRGLEPHPLPDRADARRLLHLRSDRTTVIGWAGTLHPKSPITPLFDAIALYDQDVVFAIPATGPHYQQVLDRADALEILDRIRFIRPDAGDTSIERPDLAAFPSMLSAVDAMMVAPPSGPLDRGWSLRSTELALLHGIPVIHPDVPEMADLIGAAGWNAPFGDPAVIARLVDTLHTRPALLQAAASAAAQVAARLSPAAAASELASAVAVASEIGSTARAGRHEVRRRFATALQR